MPELMVNRWVMITLWVTWIKGGCATVAMTWGWTFIFGRGAGLTTRVCWVVAIIHPPNQESSRPLLFDQR
jgi:hypothetical protein